jgi:TonB-linked SusC/RagA family outer membrane protein
MRKIATIVAVLLLLYSKLYAQNRSISGIITDANGKPLENVSVVIKPSGGGTETGKDGKFSLSLTATAKYLEISVLGYVTQTVNIGTKTAINVSLESEEKSLSEVIVVGYGTQKKKTVTAAIGKVNGESIANLPATSFDKQIAGRAAGVQVTQTSGNVSQAPRIRIRGVNSITQNRDPLFVIDGIASFNGGASGLVNNNALADINPSDIESVEILKDGAATAIYGSRAANGVILITTKKGKSGKLNVNYDMYVGAGKPFRKPKLLQAQDFVSISNEKFINANNTARANMNSDNTNTDWLDQVFNNSPKIQSHTLSVGGGNDKSNYYLSLNYLEQDGLIVTNKNRRYNIRGNLEFRPAKWLKIGNNITLGKTEDFGQNDGGNSLSGAMAAAMRALPNVRVYNAAHSTGYNITADNASLGADANTRSIENNYVNIKYVLDKNIYRNDKYRLINNFFVEISPIKNLSLRTQASVDFINSQDFQSLDAIHGDGRSVQGSVYNQNYQFSLYTWQNYVTYTRSIKEHSFTLVGGVEMQRSISQNFYGQGQTISDPFFQTTSVISNSFVNQFSGGSIVKTGFQSYFGRLNYDFKGRYFAQFSYRRDGSSRLAPDVRYGNFFGASAGYRISDESFWQSNAFLSKYFSEVKLRGGYAEVGNELSASFPWLSTYGTAPYGGVSGIATNRVGNNALQWETNKKLNIGLDLLVLKRVNISADYFVNKNDGQALDEPQPVSLGIPGNVITKNIGTMQNKGIELSISADIIRKKDFTWNASFNYTHVSNKVKTLTDGQNEVTIAGPNSGVFNILKRDQYINAFYGYNYAGVNPLNGNPMWYKEDGTMVQFNNTVTGSGYFLVNKDNTVGAATTLGNRYIIGNALPTYFGGLNNTFTYKNFTLEAFIRFQGGNKVYNLSRQEVWNSLGFVNNGVELLNRWTTPGQVTDVPKLYYGRDNQVNLQNQANGRFLESGNFIRFQNLTLAYNINGSTLQKWTKGAIKSARVYVQGQNLAIITDYSGIDPENFSELGIDNSSVPQQRIFTVGLNLGL